MLVRAGLGPRSPRFDERGLAVRRPDGSGHVAEPTAVLIVADLGTWGGGRRRAGQHPVAEGGGRRNEDQHAGDTGPANATGGCSCSSAIGHTSIQGTALLPARIRFSIRRRYTP